MGAPDWSQISHRKPHLWYSQIGVETLSAVGFDGCNGVSGGENGDDGA